jgi:hypothetical protein
VIDALRPSGQRRAGADRERYGPNVGGRDNAIHCSASASSPNGSVPRATPAQPPGALGSLRRAESSPPRLLQALTEAGAA